LMITVKMDLLAFSELICGNDDNLAATKEPYLTL